MAVDLLCDRQGTRRSVVGKHRRTDEYIYNDSMLSRLVF
ncbi:hypothetical protein SPHINGO8AM_160291 [Sphingomonas sp. 8AM]|nr:hypothetical protein SPHINGO8AM_160291 [Sphingomonas sp. 8AM]